MRLFFMFYHSVDKEFLESEVNVPLHHCISNNFIQYGIRVLLKICISI
jgi:hypothetical protein